jgi:hypothetical protein
MIFILKNDQIKQNAINAVKSAPLGQEIIIQDASTKRTDQQNRYLWGVCYKMIADASTGDKDHVHADYAGRGLGFDIISIDGADYLRPYSTKNLSKSDFADYVAFVKKKAYGDLGFIIPDPVQFGVTNE